ncbi:MAG: hypothetical protein V4731_01105 [Pseudomonadota bacterium]
MRTLALFPPRTRALHRLMLGATAFMWLNSASAQLAAYPRIDPAPTARAADPKAPVPTPAYRSVLADLPTGVEEAKVDWRDANAAVAQFKRGHADILKWETDSTPSAGAAAGKPGQEKP